MGNVNEPVKITVLIVTKNEERFISELILKLHEQTVNEQDYEIIIIDGMSTDKTVDKVQSFKDINPNLIKLISNPKQTLPLAWNLGIQAARGDYILRIDGHTLIPEDFLENYLKLIEKQPGVECVGGIINSEGTGFQGTINQYVYSHSFGVGNSKFRTIKGVWEGFVDTVPYGAYKREVFEKVGYFNEDLKRNEDIEFHKRMKDQGMRFFMSTSIQSTYYVRLTLKGLIQKSLGDGTWTMIADQSVPGSLRIRHKAPLFAFLIGLAVLLLAVFFAPMRWVLGGVGLLYLAAAKLGKSWYHQTIWTSLFPTYHLDFFLSSFFPWLRLF
ncbi:glycosyltransferase family 2 protein [Alkalicoccobacillus plakortidis]|uniref:Glycosyltransferase family 2 protein n=1 Tax=Alkalicoccobacillus plakortidis TaxID=444060 RepID=A0ABT0XIM0_9BACI|nr:glycosyltransferase family 2 protein [Alkalicoccobacillus plakortidis]MCM2675739.1 glycosyltransferase family 2 protein [Alkalicoccobacillus plakortidis]